jgi:tRNA A22 N-methylase
MILAERGSAKPLSDAEALYGPVLLRKKDPVLYEELLKQLSVREKIREQLIANPSGKTAERLTVIEKEEALLNEALGYYSRT